MKAGQQAIDRVEERWQGHVIFNWSAIRKSIPVKDVVNRITRPTPLYEEMPKVSNSKIGVTPTLLKRMVQERSQESDDD